MTSSSTRRRRYAITVRGQHCRWSFPVVAKPRDAESWRRDGLEVDEIVNTVPDWWPLSTRAWCRLEDLFRLG